MNIAPSAYSQNSGNACVNQLFAPLTKKAPTIGPISVAAAADRRPDRDLDRRRRRHLARVDDADLRHVERAGDAAHHRRERPDRELVAQRVVAGEHDAALGVADRLQDAAELAVDDRPRHQEEGDQRAAGDDEEEHPHRRRLQRHAEDPLEVGEAVVAAEAGLVAKEEQHHRVRHRLRDDREVDALDARAKGEEAEHECEQAGREDDERHLGDERIRERPVPGELLPVEEDHEVGHRQAVLAVAADLAHQVHAHGVAAEREEDAVAEREDAGVAPDEVHRQRADRVAHDLGDQLHGVFAEVEDASCRDEEVGDRHDHGDDDEGDRDAGPAAHAEQQAASGAIAAGEGRTALMLCRPDGNEVSRASTRLPGETVAARGAGIDSSSEQEPMHADRSAHASALRPFIANSPDGFL